MTEPKTKKAALYLRVSTDSQTTDNQRQVLEQVAANAGWDIVEVYEDAGISGAKGRDKRPAFDKLIKDATARQFDVVLSWSVDRLGRSLQDLIKFLDELSDLGVDLYLHQQRIDTTTASGKAMFQMIGVFAEFERAMISERVKAGLNRARAKGKRIGRPSVRTNETDRKVVVLKEAGYTITEIVKFTGVSASTVKRIIRSENEEEKAA